jgi:serine/threonine-protein kinase
MECPSCHVPNVDHARYCAKCGALLPAHAPESHDPLLGQVIKNTFRVVRLIGEGGMGRVYEGEQQMGTTTRKVAIKTLHPDLSQDPQIVARFNRECGTVAELEHPNTIQFFDFGQVPDGTLFIAMEFLEGQSVAKVLETTGPMAPARVERILKQIGGSLNEAHLKGIVHRDLKPENVVLITRAGETDFVKVLDFGIAARRESTDAKKEQKLTQQGMVLGTPPYMSPEQFTGKELDARSDIYSLGVMAYEMVTGKLPFDAATPWEWATKHLTERPFPFEMTTQAAAGIPPQMKAAILRALAKNREERQASVKQFVEELSGAAPVAAAPAPTAPRAQSGTAQMAAPPPDAFQMAAPVQQGQGMTPAHGFAGAPHQPGPTANEMVVPVQPAYVPPPPAPGTQSSGGSSKGLIIALVAVLAIGLIAGIVGVIKHFSKPSDDPGTLGPLGSSTGETVIAPIASGSDPVASAATTATATVRPPPPTATATATSTAPPKGGPQGEEACQKSAQAARNHQIEAAVNLYHGCKNGGQSVGNAHSAISSNAGPSAREARMRGDCKAAKRIAQQAQSIGAAGGAPAEAAQCK